MINQDWAKLTPEEKRQQRFDSWLNPKDVQFVSPEAEKAYKKRVQNFIDSFNITEPDAVPVILLVGNLPLELAGINYHTAIYDYTKAIQAYDSFNNKYSGELDAFFIPGMTGIPAKAFDILNYKLYAYPGHGLAENNLGYQFREGEYMLADEYDALIRDPSDFWLRTYLPRIFGAFRPFKDFQPLTSIIEIPTANLMPLADPQVRTALKAMIDAGETLAATKEPLADFNMKAIKQGFPLEPMNGMCKAPFDVIGDTLRGTTGLMKDIYRQPAILLKAMDVIADIMINTTLNTARDTKVLSIFFPLHKGADGWMSQKQFDTFYWPSLKKVMNALINDGILVRLFAEGKFDTRLEKINEFPKGSVSWWFDQTDMFRAKQVLGNSCCIQGNVPSSLLMTGTPAAVKDYCRKLIEVCGRGGGFILSPGAIVDNPKLENIRVMVEAVREYGTFR